MLPLWRLFAGPFSYRFHGPQNHGTSRGGPDFSDIYPQTLLALLPRVVVSSLWLTVCLGLWTVASAGQMSYGKSAAVADRR
jgi:hypothetical protein